MCLSLFSSQQVSVISLILWLRLITRPWPWLFQISQKPCPIISRKQRLQIKISHFANKFCLQTPSQITRPISACRYSFFRSLPAEKIFSPISSSHTMPQISAKSSLSKFTFTRRWNSRLVWYKLKCVTLLMAYEAKRSNTSIKINVKSQEVKQFVMRVRECGDRPRKRS